jgi:NAD(P)H-dependent flavin oxidoreductase YrpB (nitropropane dioxygenase family)
MAAAVCEAGGLGTIAAATMEPQELIENIRRIRKATERFLFHPFCKEEAKKNP